MLMSYGSKYCDILLFRNGFRLRRSNFSTAASKSAVALEPVVSASNVNNSINSNQSSSVINQNNVDPNVRKRDVSLTSGASIGYFFNTHHMVKKLNQCGLNEEQAETITDLLVSIVVNQSDAQLRRSVSKEQLEISVQQLLAQVDSVKKDMLILEKSELAHLRHNLDKLALGIKQLESKLVDECSKLKSGFALDMNLEKSRGKEDDHKLQSEIQVLTNRIGLEVANMRADIAHLKANFEGSRTDIIKYVARTATGTIISVCTIGFLIYRIMA